MKAIKIKYKINGTAFVGWHKNMLDNMLDCGYNHTPLNIHWLHRWLRWSTYTGSTAGSVGPLAPINLCHRKWLLWEPQIHWFFTTHLVQWLSWIHSRKKKSLRLGATICNSFNSVGAHHPLSPAIRLGIRHTRKKESGCVIHPYQLWTREQVGFSTPRKERTCPH